MEELEEFVKHFSPLQITPCAIPPHTTKEQVKQLLASFLQPGQGEEQEAAPATHESPVKHIVSELSGDFDAKRLIPHGSCKRRMWSEHISRKEENPAKVVKLEKGHIEKICFHDTIELD